MSLLTVRMIWNVATGDVSVKNLSGPINIAEYAGFSARQGILSFLSFIAVVSVSLFVLNLLPIPVLDGGQIVYQLAELVKGSPLSERAQVARRHGNDELGVAFFLSGHARRRGHGPPSSTPIKALTANQGVTGVPLVPSDSCGTTSSARSARKRELDCRGQTPPRYAPNRSSARPRSPLSF